MCPAQAFAQPTTTDPPISDLTHAGSIPKEPGALSELRNLYLADNKLTVALMLGKRVTIFSRRLLEHVSCQCPRGIYP